MLKEKISNIFFISIFVTFWLAILICLFLNKNDFNLVDNRISYKYETFNFKKFLLGDYQNNIEVATGDQLPKYNYFKILYPMVTNYINYVTVNKFDLDENNRYVDLGNVYIYDDYLIYDSIYGNDFSVYDEDIAKINHIAENTSASMYVYYINNDNNINFSINEQIDIERYLKQNLIINVDNIDSLTVSNFSDYKRYFYKLDHHWNNVGTDVAYSDIVDMMGLDNKLVVNNTICFNNKDCYGSKSKSIAMEGLLSENYCVYNYNFPNFNIKINGEVVSDYGMNFESLGELNILSYANIYGGDYAEIIFENKDISNDKNLLIYSNSYSNSINKLLASHYKNTYVIDGRYNNKFDMVDYINQNNIDDVLILSNKMLFYDDVVWGDF